VLTPFGPGILVAVRRKDLIAEVQYSGWAAVGFITIDHISSGAD